jgi:hypothetical protein
MKRQVSDSSSNMSRDEIEVVNRKGVEGDEAMSVETGPELVTVVGAGPAGLMLG